MLIPYLDSLSTDTVLAELDAKRSRLAKETDPTAKVTYQLMIDEITAELARRNAAVFADRAARAGAS